jgi:hypothetical protein
MGSSGQERRARVIAELVGLRQRCFFVGRRLRDEGFATTSDQCLELGLQVSKLLQDFIEGRSGIPQHPGQTSLTEQLEDTPF